MEFKLRANIVMSKEITIEAEDLAVALEKAQAMMAEPFPMKELTARGLYFDVLSGIKWADDSKFLIENPNQRND